MTLISIIGAQGEEVSMIWLKKLARKLAECLLLWARPDQDELVLALTLYTASLELPHGECIELAPIKGCCGPFRLYGNSLPIFKYKVFDKSIMEFVEVLIEVSKPGRIDFLSTIDSNTAPELHGKEVVTKDKYKEPFNQLAQHLFRYFPYYKKVIP